MPAYDVLRAFELMHQGKMNGYFCQGFNPLLSFPNRKKCTEALSKLKFLVTMDPLETETSRFWENHGEYNDVDPAQIQTEVIQLPSDLLCGGRGVADQLQPLAAMALAGRHAAGRGQARHLDHGADLAAAEGALREGGRAGSRPDPQSALALCRSGRSDGRRDRPGDQWLRDRAGLDPTDPTKVLVEKGKQVAGFAQLRDDGSTACGCWIYSGCFNEEGNNMARRDNTDPDDAGFYPNWAFSWPANRRILYNRASADMNGKPWDPSAS